MVFMFLSFLFVGILSFVYYSGVLFFIIGFIIIFFFLALHLFVFQIKLFGNKEELKKVRKPKNGTAGVVFNILLPLLFCTAAGYLIYEYTSDFLLKATVSEEITIVSLSDITGQFLTDYSLILIFITALLFISFLWFLIIGQGEK